MVRKSREASWSAARDAGISCIVPSAIPCRFLYRKSSISGLQNRLENSKNRLQIMPWYNNQTEQMVLRLLSYHAGLKVNQE
jgi:hypothetical protein